MFTETTKIINKQQVETNLTMTEWEVLKDLIADETLETAEMPKRYAVKIAKNLFAKGWVTEDDGDFFIKDHLLTLAINIKAPN